MHVQAAYRPAHRQAPKRPVVPPKAYEPTIFERERVLATRVRITDRTLERLLPSTEQVISRRVANYRAAVPQETLSKLMLTRAEYMTNSLQGELRAAKEEIDRTRFFLRPAAPGDGVPRRGPSHKGVHPTKVELQRLLEKPNTMLSFVPGIDLRGFDLAYQDFRGAALAGGMLDAANLKGSHMAEMTLTRASLRSCNLQCVSFERSDLVSANLSGSNLSHANLKDANLTSANLSRAVLMRSDFSGASLSGAKLDGAVASLTILTGCDLRGASLRDVQLAGVVDLASCTMDNLRGASFAACDVTGVNLRGVDMTGATLGKVIHLKAARLDNLRGAVLAGCKFQGVSLGGVDLSGADLGGANFEGAVLEEPAPAEGCAVETFPLGDPTSVGAGAIVHYSGFVICVSASHPSSDVYAYFGDPGTAWGRASQRGCFDKRMCRVLVPAPM